MVARTPYARARGLGSAGSGSREYWLLKLTSVALLPLLIFFAGLLVALMAADHAQVFRTLSLPLVAVPLILLVVVNAVHMRIGMKNVIDDYVHGATAKKVAVAANLFFTYALTAAALYFILIIGIGG